MAVAWLKLHRRNLGPILDANGWAVNAQARVNVPLGGSLTKLAELPKGSTLSLTDPFAEKKTPWRFYAGVAIVVLIACAWLTGHLDFALPQSVRSSHVFHQDTAPAEAHH
jgi:hypothetical protein